MEMLLVLKGSSFEKKSLKYFEDRKNVTGNAKAARAVESQESTCQN